MSNDEPPTTYSHIHRAFLQALLSRGTITFEEAKPLLAIILTVADPQRPTAAEDITHEDFDEYISTISTHITSFDFEIRSSLHQTKNNRIWALVNTTSDAMTQMATVHSADEMAFVKRVLDAMFDTYNTQQAEIMAIRSTQALNLARAPDGARDAGLTKKEGEIVLETLVQEGWFDKSAQGFYSLSQRGIMELRTWLEDMYNEAANEEDGEEVPHLKIKACAACRDVVTIGVRCPNLVCNTRLHEHCVRNAMRARGNEEKCPACQTEWIDAPPVGEKAAQRGSGGAARNSRGGRRSSGRQTQAEDSDEE